ncbi:IclR family transcriptional regulator [Acidithiobacillus acidisediminis]|jgi:DNA-binding IclR family transcriptional regulator|uniref:IclR family transcriptional regulator n=1 Tax=Acidithiobacillus TaxID=119977 RepID=UPI00200F4CAE|nr:IclR family transcriptional regulator [Acidithiobacillus sp. S30A2]
MEQDRAHSENRGSVQVIDRLCLLLDALAQEGGNTSLKVLSAVTGLAPSSAYRILASALENRLLERDLHGNYRFGTRLLDWSRLIHGRADLRALAQPAMAELRDEIEETVNLTVEHGDEVLYIERAISPRMMRVEQVIGSHAPMHCTAVGKLMLAQHGYDWVRAYARRSGLPTLTAHSLGTLPALWKALQQAQADGYARDDEEAEIGVGCLGVLIHTPLPCLIGLSISSPIHRRKEEWIPLLHRAAEQIEQRLQGLTVVLDLNSTAVR